MAASFLQFLSDFFEQNHPEISCDSFVKGISKFPLAAHVNFKKYPFLVNDVLECKRKCLALEDELLELQDDGIYIPKPLKEGKLASWKVEPSANASDDTFTASKMYWFANGGQTFLGDLLPKIEEKASEGRSHLSVFLAQLDGVWRVFDHYSRSPTDRLIAPSLEVPTEILEALGYGVAKRSFTFAQNAQAPATLFHELIVFWQDHEPKTIANKY